MLDIRAHTSLIEQTFGKGDGGGSDCCLILDRRGKEGEREVSRNPNIRRESCLSVSMELRK